MSRNTTQAGYPVRPPPLPPPAKKHPWPRQTSRAQANTHNACPLARTLPHAHTHARTQPKKAPRSPCSRGFPAHAAARCVPANKQKEKKRKGNQGTCAPFSPLAVASHIFFLLSCFWLRGAKNDPPGQVKEAGVRHGGGIP